MKLSMLTKLCVPLAFLAFGAVGASAATCGTTTLVALQLEGSCTQGDLTFSNFTGAYTAGVVVGAPPGTVAPAEPNPNLVVLTFTTLTDGVTADPWGTVGSPTAPLTTVVTDYSGTNNSVDEFQTQEFLVGYTVTDTVSGAIIDEVDDNINGSATNGASSVFTAKDVCAGGSFDSSGGTPLDTGCPGHGNVYQAVADTGTALTGIADSGSDSTSDFSANAPFFQGPGSSGSSVVGVFDQADLNGNDTNGAAFGQITQVENDFLEELPTSGTPEPGTFILLGGALVGLGVIRRRKSA